MADVKMILGTGGGKSRLPNVLRDSLGYNPARNRNATTGVSVGKPSPSTKKEEK